MRSLLACLLFGGSATAANWIRISTPSIEIFTDCKENTARSVLRRFETLHRIFGESYGADSSHPLRAFVFFSSEEFAAYRPTAAAAAFFQSHPDRDFIILHQEDAQLFVASHEYLHMVIQHASAKFPPWLEEGIPEFYSTVSANATTVRIGEPVPGRIEELASRPWFSAGDLALGTARDGGMFYAESWALVHMLSLSREWRAGMPEFVRRLTQGEEQHEAFHKAFGRSMDDAISALRVYIRNPVVVTEPAPPEEAPGEIKVLRLTAVEAMVTLADLALHTDHPKLARSLFLRAAKENPQSPAAVAGLGSLALVEDRKEDAQREFERAIAMGYRDAGTFYALATLKNDPALLEQALAVDPDFADAHFVLGARATDEGDFASAIRHLRRAVELEPRRFTLWHALGYAQFKSDDRQGAAESARRAAAVALTPQEEEMAASLTLLAAGETAIREKKPGVITPPSWQNPKGDVRTEGTLISVDCDSNPVRLTISPPSGKEIELRVQNPAEVELLNGEGVSTTLVCGKQSRPVAVEYLSATKQITRMELKHVVIIKR